MKRARKAKSSVAPSSSLKKCKKDHSMSDLEILGQQLISSRSHINNLPALLTFISPNFPPQYALESLLSLQSFFTPLLPLLPSSSSPRESNPDPDFIYRAWLRSKFDNFIQQLYEVYISQKSEDALREVVLDAIMEFVKVGNAGKFHSAIYHKLIQAILEDSLWDADYVLLDLLSTKYFKFVDVRYFTYISLGKLARTLEGEEEKNGFPCCEDKIQSRSSMDASIHKIHYLLSHIPSLEDSVEKPDLDMWNGSGVFTKRSDDLENIDEDDNNDKSLMPTSKVRSSRSVAKKMKLKFTKAWMGFLSLPLPLGVYKEVLATLHKNVIPYLSNPIMLCDFLTRSYDIGGIVSVMSLSSLYILMTQHGLEYSNFYDKLYALLEPSIFMAKHRAKFFELLDSCLKSSLLPAYFAASFCKKLSRLTLQSPPSGALVCIALVHNLLQRHPSINCLVNRECATETDGITTEEDHVGNESVENHSSGRESIDQMGGFDHFKNNEIDVKFSNAMRSSLWEIDNLRNHYCPPVSRFALSLENDLTMKGRTAEVAVRDFCSASYATIFDNENRRRIKQVPLAFYKSTPTSLFTGNELQGWTFNV